jgi:hypothetical protein
MAVLLVLLLVMVFIVPFVTTPSSAVGRILEDVLFSLILLNGAAAASGRPREFVLIGLVGLVAIIMRWASWFAPASFADEATPLALVLLAVSVALRVFGPGTVTRDRIAGAVTFYILAGVIWADLYYLVSLHVPGAFSGMTHGESPEDRSIWVYFSFITLTTVGYGDITPVAHAARSLSNLESLIGQLYPAIVLARLVSLQVAGGGSEKDKS